MPDYIRICNNGIAIVDNYMRLVGFKVATLRPKQRRLLSLVHISIRSIEMSMASTQDRLFRAKENMCSRLLFV